MKSSLKIVRTVFVLLAVAANGVAYSHSMADKKRVGAIAKVVVPDKMDSYNVITKGNSMSYMKKRSANAHAYKAGETVENVSMTFRFEYDETQYSPSSVYVYDPTSEFASNEYFEGGDIVMSVPKGGCYDVCVASWINSGELGQLSYVIKEQLQVDENMEIVIRPADATKHIRFESVLPNGEEMKFSTFDASGEQLISEGNCDAFFCNYYICLLGFGSVANNIHMNSIGNLQNSDGTFTQRERDADIYINEGISDRYGVFQSRILKKDGVFYFHRLKAKGGGQEVVRNNPNDYVKHVEHFNTSPLGETSTSHYNAFGTMDYVTGESMWGWTVVGAPTQIKDGNAVYYIDNPKDSDQENGVFHSLVYPAYTDYVYEIVGERPDGVQYTEEVRVNTMGLPIFTNNGEVDYVNEGYDYLFRIDGEMGKEVTFAHPAFSYSEKERTGVYGNSCPINVLVSENYFDEYVGGKLFRIFPYPVGRLGEVRNTDLETMKMSVKYNGEEVANDFSKWYEFCFNWAKEKHPDGEIDATFVNHNVRVDGVEGTNTTRVTFDQRREDWTAPTLQMLHFKNTSGMVTDRFDFPSDGILEFAGGDFNCQFNEAGKKYFDCKPQTVEVCYSPYGRDAWQPLAVDEIPDLFSRPAFGYFYRGSLANVKGVSDNGWFDLKIALTDEAGNKQEQIISPAFKIGDGASVNSVRSHSVDSYYTGGKLYVKADYPVSMKLYSMDGVQVMSNVDAPSVMDMSTLPTGMYVVELTGAHGRTVCKFVK